MMWLEGLKRWMRGEVPPHALVIGAGVAGLTSALFLDACGARTSVFEKGSERRRGPRSVILSESALEGYDSIGLMSAILQASNPLARTILNVGGRPLDPRLKPRVGSRVLPHSQLLEILEDELESRWILVERGKRVISVNQSPSQAYATTDGGTRTAATHIIAADGSASVAHSAFTDPRAVQRVRGWSISGVSTRRHLPASLAARIDQGVSLMASQEHMHFIAQMDDPTDDEVIAWSLYLRSAQNVAASAVSSADRRSQLLNAVRALERLAPSVIGMVRASHGVAVRAVISPGRAPIGMHGRIATVGSARHGDLPLLSALSADRYAESMEITERLAVSAP
jgi:2-polyprenyl-6-methoxyphenol hydroxylase-like FAD-dependent oxidoreductase